jgi:hypothetical protein
VPFTPALFIPSCVCHTFDAFIPHYFVYIIRNRIFETIFPLITWFGILSSLFFCVVSIHPFSLPVIFLVGLQLSLLCFSFVDDVWPLRNWLLQL